MKHLSIIALIIIGLLLLFQPDISPFFTVPVMDEGIVTQNGKIVGGLKGPGLHVKWPIIQKVQTVNIHKIWFLAIETKNNEVKAKVLWDINDSLKYFEAIRTLGGEDKLALKFASYCMNSIDGYSFKVLNQIADGQKKDIEFTNEAYERIVETIQEYSKNFGLKIVRIDLLNT